MLDQFRREWATSQSTNLSFMFLTFSGTYDTFTVNILQWYIHSINAYFDVFFKVRNVTVNITIIRTIARYIILKFMHLSLMVNL